MPSRRGWHWRGRGARSRQLPGSGACEWGLESRAPRANTSATRQAFGTILHLLPLAESVVKLNAVCMECFREAAYTKRLGQEKEVVARCSPGEGGSGCCACSSRPLCVPRSR